MNLDGNPAVDTGTGDLLQDRRTLVGSCLEKDRKAPLRQQHRAGEPFEIHAGDILNHFGNGGQLRLKDFAATCRNDFVLWRLQLPNRLFARAVLAPVAAKVPFGRFKFHLGKTFACLP